MEISINTGFSLVKAPASVEILSVGTPGIAVVPIRTNCNKAGRS